MRLFAVANRYYLITLLIVFLLGSVGAFFILTSIVNANFNRKLLAEKSQLIEELHTYQDLSDFYYLNIGDRIMLEEQEQDSGPISVLRDTIMYDAYLKQELPFRVLTFSDDFRGKNYLITISKSLLSTQEMIRAVAEIMTGTFLVLIISLLLLNQHFSKKLWTPFYRLLDQTKIFNLNRPERMTLERSAIEEFEELRKVLINLMDKTLRDYENLKEYAENTSHEFQTPLAIIKNKSELLLQENLTEEQGKKVATIYESAARLSKLKEGLTLLAKIENNQFSIAEPIDIKGVLLKKINDLDELIIMKGLKISTTFYAAPIVVLNPTLTHMLFSNLLNNAIKHNNENGEIILFLKENELTIRNSGRDPGVKTELLFGRFKHVSRDHESSGLGLAIVQRIVEFYQMKIRYNYANGWHELVLNF